MKPHLQVTAALIFYQGRVLVARRPVGSRHGGFWEFPGGKTESGETLEQCLKREIREELGREIHIEGEGPRVDHDYGDFSLTLHTFFCRPLGNWSLPSTEVEQTWVHPAKLDGFDLLPPDREVSRAIRQTLWKSEEK